MVAGENTARYSSWGTSHLSFASVWHNVGVRELLRCVLVRARLMAYIHEDLRQTWSSSHEPQHKFAGLLALFAYVSALLVVFRTTPSERHP